MFDAYEGTSFRVHCPANCDSVAGTVYGSSLYRDDSPICLSAIHNGVIQASGGFILVGIESGRVTY